MGEWKIVPDEQPTKGEWKVAEEAPAPDEWRQTDFGFRVKPTVTHNGTQSVQREDGLVWYGPQQGNTGKPGWFDSKGLRGPDAPVKDWYSNMDPDKGVSWADRLLNRQQETKNKVASQGLMKTVAQEAGNTSVIASPASLIRDIRQKILGYQEPAKVEQYLADPTVGRVVQGLHDTVAAPVQLGANLVAPASAGQAVNDYVTKEKAAADAMLRPSVTGEMLGQALPFVLSGGASAAAQATGAPTMAARLAALGKGAATGAVLAPVLTPEANVQGAVDYWDRKGREALIGGGLGLGGTALGQGAEAFSRRLSAPMAPEAQRVADLGEQFGVRTLAPDLAASPGMNKLAVLAESVPGSGMVAQRTAQQAEARAAAEKLLAQHGIEGEVPATIHQSLQNKLASTKGKVRAAYDAVSNEAQGLGDIAPDSTLEAIRKFKAQESKAVIPDKTLVGEGHHPGLLTVLENRLKPGKADLSYEGLRGLRSDLGSMISDYYKGTNATTGSKGVQVLKGVRDAVEADLKAFTDAQGGEIASLARKADSLYKNELVPLKDQVIVKATKNSEPDQIYKAIVAAGPGRAQKFYGAMDANGQAAVRSQMIQDAFSAATKKDGVFSPAEFAKALEGIKESTGVFFKGKDKFELDGFTNLMRHIQRAGQINENPTNGQRLVTALMAGEGIGSVSGAMMGHPAALVAPVASVGSARILTKVFASPAGKRFLLAASDLPAGSKALNTLIERDLPKILGAEAKNITPLRTAQPMPLPAAAQTENQDRIAQQ